MAQRIDLTLDCTDVHAMAPFWKLALGYVDEPPPALKSFIEQFRASIDG